MSKKELKPVAITPVVEDKAFKSTKAEVNQRVTEVQDLIMKGFTRTDILQYGSKWDVSDRTIDEYLAGARRALKEINSSTLQDNQAIIVGGLWGIYRSAINGGNLAEAHKVLMSIAKLKGLEQTTINHIIEDKRELETLSDTELDAILDAENKVQ